MPKTVSDFVLYDQLAIVGQKSVNFFGGTYTEARSNFPGGFQLPQGENALILGYKVLSGANAVVSSTDWQPGMADALGKQGTITTLINGQVVNTQIPLTVFDPNQLSATGSGATDDNRGFMPLYEPLVLMGQQQITMQANWPVLPPATANLNMRIELHGIRFIGS